MAGSTLSVTSAAGFKRGDKIVIGDGNGQAARVVARSGSTLDVTPWRWYHTVATWPRRAWYRSRDRAEDLYLRLFPEPEDPDDED